MAFEISERVLFIEVISDMFPGAEVPLYTLEAFPVNE